jgi:hypothetical protein
MPRNKVHVAIEMKRGWKNLNAEVSYVQHKVFTYEQKCKVVP